MKRRSPITAYAINWGCTDSKSYVAMSESTPPPACSYSGSEDGRPLCPAWVLPAVVIFLAVSAEIVRRVLYARRVAQYPDIAQWSRDAVRGQLASQQQQRTSGRLSVTSEAQMPTKRTFDIKDVNIVSLPSSLASSSCVICLEPLKGPQPVIRGPCEHIFHRVCISAWLAKDKATSCPTCRATFEPVITDPARERSDTRHFSANELDELEFRDDAPV